MKERPILFNSEMVRAVLDGRKTQTRRAMKVQSPHWKRVVHVLWGKLAEVLSCRKPIDTSWVGFDVGTESGSPHYYKCPYGQPGDKLWVRETCRAEEIEYAGWEDGVRYLADNHWRVIENTREAADAWVELNSYRDQRGAVVPSIHMPRWASRINLEITSVRVERLQDISEEDAKAEGCFASGWYPTFGDPDNATGAESKSATDEYAQLWKSINGSGSWDANPWVWVIEFKKIA